MPGPEVLVLTIRVKESAFQHLSEQLVQSVMSELLSEKEAERAAMDLISSSPQEFLDFQVDDRVFL
jgi:hypothetical protein